MEACDAARLQHAVLLHSCLAVLAAAWSLCLPPSDSVYHRPSYLKVLTCSQSAMTWEHWSGQNPGGSSAPEQQSQLPSSTCEVGSMPPSGHANMAPWAAQAEVPTNHNSSYEFLA